MNGNKINKIQWGKIKTAWELLKMSTAYIHAEQKIITEAEQGNDITGFQSGGYEKQMTPEQFHDEITFDGYGNPHPLTPKEMLYDKAKEVLKQLQQAVQDEDYRKASLLDQTLKVIKIKYDKL